MHKNGSSVFVKAVFSKFCGPKGNWVLTKRSTLVDQNIRSYKGRSQLSVDIFIAPRTHFPAQKSFIYKKMSKKDLNPWQPPPLFSETRDITPSADQGGGFPGFTGFDHFFYYINDFWATRWVLGAIKIATDSWDLLLQDLTFWSTSVDLLVNTSIALWTT